ncbi:MAG: ABC transporter substrate-binding protein [Chloroflexi bacterium]|nr:ABC transporter substrate-binding protein [Chloroflexota bacterium]
MRKLFIVLSLLMVASMLLSACGGAPATPQTIVQTVVVAGAPQIVEVTPTSPPATEFKSKDTTTMTIAESEVSIDTLDPALAYDTASGEIIQNVYSTLVFYDGEATDKFVPMLAESWTTSADGTSWVFKIRKGVKFHDGAELTASDVAYSFQRGLLQGGTSSPQWLLTEPFFGVGTDDISVVVDPNGTLYDDREALSKFDAVAVKAACEKTKAAIVADDAAGTVTMTLAQGWGPFLATIAQSWGSILEQKWVVANKGWDGSCDTWQNFYGMASADDPISTIANGTGPFKLDSLKQGEEYILSANADYFAGPAKLSRIVAKAVPEWGTRFAMMQAGDADFATVPSANRSQMDALVGEKCVFDITTNAYKPCEVTDPNQPFRVRLGRPTISQDVILYNWNIASDKASPNPYIGSGQLDGNGIPQDFFSDVNVRKGFSYCFDWETLINDVYKGEATQSFQLTLPGMPGFFNDTPHYTTDLAKCEEAFKASTLKSSDGKSLWDVGFRIQMAYNQGNPTRQTTAEILAGNLATVNPKFQLETLGLPWAAYLRAQRAKLLPIMTGGWLEDIHDPHNWYQPYTTGTYGGRQALPADVKAQFKAILDRGVAELDPAKRGEIYKEANQLYYDLAVGTPMVLPTGHGFAQRWVGGQILNPIFPGFYYYTMFKN